MGTARAVRDDASFPSDGGPGAGNGVRSFLLPEDYDEERDHELEELRWRMAGLACDRQAIRETADALIRQMRMTCSRTR